MKSTRFRSVFLCDRPQQIDRVYAAGRRGRVASLTDLRPEVITGDMLKEGQSDLSAIRVAFSTWGMPRMDPTMLSRLPDLEAVFYAAGSVRKFAGPLLDNGIVVVSSWQANAVPVAEFTMAQVLLANKLYFANSHLCSSSASARSSVVRNMPGNFGETVAILGAGAIGRKVIDLLRQFQLKLIVWDPFLPAEQAEQIGAEKVETLNEAFSRAFTISNHLANVPETVGLLKEEHFAAMRPNATFINTGRGATVDEPGLARVFSQRPDLTALLDVTCPEPPKPESPLYQLPNIHLSSHIAGSIGDEVVRLADYAIEEFEAWRDGRPLRYEVTREMLETMA